MRNNFKARLATVTQSMTPTPESITQQHLCDIRTVLNGTDAGREAVECQYAAARLRHVGTAEAKAEVSKSISQATTKIITGAKQLGLVELVSHLESCCDGGCDGGRNAAR
ncbi:MAG: hypothetical protein GXP24_06420 [Planctomycetes bacterium]|nr:hypothetical protein [Planctomycetota bacterium]